MCRNCDNHTDIYDPMIGVTIAAVDVRIGSDDDDDCITFTGDDSRQWGLRHDQDCCEEVVIEDICGDLNLLVGRKIAVAEIAYSDASNERDDESATWTFCRIGNDRGDLITIRWYGTSNGYYCERADFDELRSP